MDDEHNSLARLKATMPAKQGKSQVQVFAPSQVMTIVLNTNTYNTIQDAVYDFSVGKWFRVVELNFPMHVGLVAEAIDNGKLAIRFVLADRSTTLPLKVENKLTDHAKEFISGGHPASIYMSESFIAAQREKRR